MTSETLKCHVFREIKIARYPPVDGAGLAVRLAYPEEPVHGNGEVHDRRAVVDHVRLEPAKVIEFKF